METHLDRSENAWMYWFANAVSIAVLAATWRILMLYWWIPASKAKALESQGVKGLRYRFFWGNTPEIDGMRAKQQSSPIPLGLHDILQRVLPHYYEWSRTYGQRFFYWHGSTPRMTVLEPELIKLILANKSGDYQKPPRRPESKDIVGNGLLSVKGQEWALHRRIVSPAFHMEKLKAMVPTILESASNTFEKWERRIHEADSGRAEIDVLEQFRALTADVIARTAFGSSYREGKQVFESQHQQRLILSESVTTVYIPGSRLFPTARNWFRWKLDRQIQRSLRKIIQNRVDSSSTLGGEDAFGDDLLGLMLAANKQELQGTSKKSSLTIQDIVDECKTFFFAGHETTSTLLTWTIMLLASHSEWQERAREEVRAICGSRLVDAEALSHLKIVGGHSPRLLLVSLVFRFKYPSHSIQKKIANPTYVFLHSQPAWIGRTTLISERVSHARGDLMLQVTMVLNESLRLYSPVTFLIRRTQTALKLGKINIPEGTELFLPMLALHHSAEMWGEDAKEFNPERFAEGVAKAAKHLSAFMPFSNGPRFCVGQNLAILEAKLILSLLLQRFSSFSISPAYRHAPTSMTASLQPQYGMQIIFEKNHDK